MILPLPLPRFFWPHILGSTVALGLIGAIFFIDQDRDYWRDEHKTLLGQVGKMVETVAFASDNPEVTWETAPGQVIALGEANRTLRISLDKQNKTIADQARETVRLKAHATELQRIVDQAKAQRDVALKRLADMAITPGEREDCMILLAQAEEALDIAWEAGL